MSKEVGGRGGKRWIWTGRITNFGTCAARDESCESHVIRDILRRTQDSTPPEQLLLSHLHNLSPSLSLRPCIGGHGCRLPTLLVTAALKYTTHTYQLPSAPTPTQPTSIIAKANPPPQPSHSHHSPFLLLGLRRITSHPIPSLVFARTHTTPILPPPLNKLLYQDISITSKTPANLV